MRTEDITIGFYSGADEQVRDIVVRYWSQGERRAFEESVESLCRETGVSPEGLLHRIRQYSAAHLTVSRCVQCGGTLPLNSRNDYLKRMRAEFPCDSCLYPPDIDDDDDDDEWGALSSQAEGLGVAKNENTESSSLGGSGPDVSLDGVDELASVVEMPGVMPTRLHAALSVSLGDFTKNPAAVVQACNGESLVVMQGDEPLFYCVSPGAMVSRSQ